MSDIRTRAGCQKGNMKDLTDELKTLGLLYISKAAEIVAKHVTDELEIRREDEKKKEEEDLKERFRQEFNKAKINRWQLVNTPPENLLRRASTDTHNGKTGDLYVGVLSGSFYMKENAEDNPEVMWRCFCSACLAGGWGGTKYTAL